MKKQVLKSIYIFCILHFTFCIYSNAQIVYFDIIPDVTLNNNGIYNLDLDNDGSTDFILNNYYQVLGTCGMAPIRMYRVGKVSTTSGNSFANINSNPSCLSYGNLIDSTLNWSTGIITDTLEAYLHPTCSGATFKGNWGSTNDRYLPLRKKIGADNYYGWVRMVVNLGLTSQFIIKGYAYDTIPNQFIFAGDTANTFVLAVSSVIASPMCFGSNFNLGYTAFGNYDTTNIFNAELSDSIGNFSNPVIIGSINNSQSGFFNVTIPFNIPDGYKYRIRVTSTFPVLIAPDNGTNLIIYSLHPPNTVINLNGDSICPYDPFNQLYNLTTQITFPFTTLFTYQWQNNGIDIPNATFPGFGVEVPGTNAFQNFIYTVVVSDVCASDTSSPVPITVFPSNATLAPFLNACITDPPLVLNGGTPVGGHYMLTVNGQFFGSIGSTLNYSSYGVGNYAIYYYSQTPDSFGCNYAQSDTEYFNVSTCTGIEEDFSMTNGFSISILDKILSVRLDKNNLKTVNICICNSIGETIKKVSIKNKLTQIEMSDCSSGIYFVIVQTNDAIETNKIYLK